MTDRPVVHRPAHDHRLARAEHAEHRQGPRLGARRRRGRGDQEAARLRPGPVPSRSTRRGARARPRGRSSAARRRTPSGRRRLRRLAQPRNPERAALFDRLSTRELPDGWTDALPTFAADPKGMATRAASGKVLNALGAGAARAVGRLGRPRRVEQHHDRGRARRSCPTTGDPAWPRRPLRPGAALRHPRARAWARSSTASRCTAAPARTAARSWCSATTCARPVRLAALMQLPGHLRLDARLDRPGRGRPDPPAGRAPRRAAGDPGPGRRPPGRRQRDRGRLADDPASTPTGPAGLVLTRQNLPVSTARSTATRRRRRHGRLRPGRGRPTATPQVILIGTGSEVQLAVAARERLEAEGIPTRVVSMPCVEWFEEQDEAYRESGAAAGGEGPGLRRGRRRAWAGATSSATPAGHQPRALRGVRRRHDAVPRVRHHRRSRRRRRPGEPREPVGCDPHRPSD